MCRPTVCACDPPNYDARIRLTGDAGGVSSELGTGAAGQRHLGNVRRAATTADGRLCGSASLPSTTVSWDDGCDSGPSLLSGGGGAGRGSIKGGDDGGTSSGGVGDDSGNGASSTEMAGADRSTATLATTSLAAAAPPECTVGWVGADVHRDGPPASDAKSRSSCALELRSATACTRPSSTAVRGGPPGSTAPTVGTRGDGGRGASAALPGDALGTTSVLGAAGRPGCPPAPRPRHQARPGCGRVGMAETSTSTVAPGTVAAPSGGACGGGST